VAIAFIVLSLAAFIVTFHLSKRASLHRKDGRRIQKVADLLQFTSSLEIVLPEHYFERGRRLVGWMWVCAIIYGLSAIILFSTVF
jgi:hypothetical protein